MRSWAERPLILPDGAEKLPEMTSDGRGAARYSWDEGARPPATSGIAADASKMTSSA